MYHARCTLEVYMMDQCQRKLNQVQTVTEDDSEEHVDSETEALVGETAIRCLGKAQLALSRAHIAPYDGPYVI